MSERTGTESAVVAMPRVSSAWLALREAADAAARASELADMARDLLSGGSRAVIHDLGCGTGSMGRWLAPRLRSPQHWVMYDRDADLLDEAAAGITGAAVTVETRQRDVSLLTAADLAGAGLVTASALLDLLTEEEVGSIAAAVAGAGCPALLTLSVVGRVDLAPADPLDGAVTAAFNAHQRRMSGTRRLLGPDAVEAAVDAFTRNGMRTVVRDSPWRLCRHDADLISEWLAGWLEAACEQQPELAGPVAAYAARRRSQLEAGQLTVTVHHADLLAR